MSFETQTLLQPQDLSARPVLLEHVLLDQADGLERLVEYGYNPEHEARRAILLYETLGEVGLDIALREQINNRESYWREFMEDEPVSLPRDYYMYEGKLHSYPLPHQLTRVESGINPAERDGLTTKGFGRYQELLDGEGDEVVVWYSHAGQAGTSGEYKNLFYEAGRLYFGVKRGDNVSRHIDIKVQEGDNVEFPILEFLNSLSGRDCQDLKDYLREPFTLKTAESLLDQLCRSPLSERTVYTSRRNEKTKLTEHSLWQITKELEQAFLSQKNPDAPKRELPEGFNITGLFDKKVIDDRYRGDHVQFMEREGIDRLTLYGCSTTSIVDSSLGDFFSNSFTNQSTIFASSVPTEFFSSEKVLKCVTCPFCEKIVDATIKNGRIHCAPTNRGGCGKSVSLTKTNGYQ